MIFPFASAARSARSAPARGPDPGEFWNHPRTSAPAPPRTTAQQARARSAPRLDFVGDVGRFDREWEVLRAALRERGVSAVDSVSVGRYGARRSPEARRASLGHAIESATAFPAAAAAGRGGEALLGRSRPAPSFPTRSSRSSTSRRSGGWRTSASRARAAPCASRGRRSRRWPRPARRHRRATARRTARARSARGHRGSCRRRRPSQNWQWQGRRDWM